MSATPEPVRPIPPRGFERLVGSPIGEILIQLGAATADDVGQALLDQEEKGVRLGELLVAENKTTDLAVAKALGIQLDMPIVEKIDIDHVPDALVQPVPISFAKQNFVLPLGVVGDATLVAIADPLNNDALDDLGMLLKSRVSAVISTKAVITEAINRVYDRATGLAHEAVKNLQSDDEENADLDAIDLIDESATDDAPIIRFVNALLRDAVKMRASDIHIECFERKVVVRNRVDGILYKKVEAPKQAQAPIIARVKIMADLDIAEKRLPQDGRIRRKIAGKDIDVRVSTVPTSHGERIVMRILDRSQVLLSLEDLGFAEDVYKTLVHLINRPHGILLVSGPTGSGKTTTLYAALSKINNPDINILTVEDPVEYQLQGVGQMQVQPKIDLTFASGLRAFLRQDPDVIMVGEIRDRETAEIAIQASLTGHLVLSTVHTNDAPGAVTRLVEMGIEPYLVASSLVGVLAQRLVRTLCPVCRAPHQPSAAELAQINLRPDPQATFFREQGCDQCFRTGFQGRRGIYELLVINDQLRQLVIKNVDAATLKKAAVSFHMRTLLEDGARLAKLGFTTPEEVLRVAVDEEIVVEV